MTKHLDKKELRHLQEILNAKEIAARIRTHVSIPDELDEADTASAADVDERLNRMTLTELADIEAAQRRMQNHQYGICIECGCAIDYKRLQAYPTAKRCANCQLLYERRIR